MTNLTEIKKPKSTIYFLLKPKGGSQYVDNAVSIESADDVNRIGIVLSTPPGYEGIIEEGDEVVVHHNVFRRTYTSGGIPKESFNYISENLFFVYPETIFMVIKAKTNEIQAVYPNVFVQPTDDNYDLSKSVANVRYCSDKTIEELGIEKDSTVALKNYSDYKFRILGELFYKIHQSQIIGIL